MSAPEENTIPCGDEAQNGNSQLGDMIDKLLANPELINMVASAVGRSAPSLDAKQDAPKANDGGEAEKASAPKDLADLPELMSALSPVIASLKGGDNGGRHAKADKRACLLCALKPYLCQGRCEAIDYMIKLGRIAELIRNMS